MELAVQSELAVLAVSATFIPEFLGGSKQDPPHSSPLPVK